MVQLGLVLSPEARRVLGTDKDILEWTEIRQMGLELYDELLRGCRVVIIPPPKPEESPATKEARLLLEERQYAKMVGQPFWDSQYPSSHSIRHENRLESQNVSLELRKLIASTMNAVLSIFGASGAVFLLAHRYAGWSLEASTLLATASLMAVTVAEFFLFMRETGDIRSPLEHRSK